MSASVPNRSGRRKPGNDPVNAGSYAPTEPATDLGSEIVPEPTADAECQEGETFIATEATMRVAAEPANNPA
jgi:hypothetical protein